MTAVVRYTDEEDIRTLLRQVTEKQLPEKLIAICQRKADSLIDSLLCVCYAIPIRTTADEVPDAIRSAAEDLVLWFLCGTPPLAGVTGGVYKPTDLQQRKADAIQWLKDLAAGKAQLDGVTRTRTVTSTTENYTTTFNLDDELCWAPDSDMLDEIASERE